MTKLRCHFTWSPFVIGLDYRNLMSRHWKNSNKIILFNGKKGNELRNKLILINILIKIFVRNKHFLELTWIYFYHQPSCCWLLKFTLIYYIFFLWKNSYCREKKFIRGSHSLKCPINNFEIFFLRRFYYALYELVVMCKIFTF